MLIEESICVACSSHNKLRLILNSIIRLKLLMKVGNHCEASGSFSVFRWGGPDIALGARENYWRGAPAVLKGNAQRTNYAGYAQHTFKTGGEDIFLWDVDRQGVLKLPSPMVQNCTWVRTPVGQFEHTGVKLRFQRRQNGVVPRRQILEDLEARVKALEARLGM